MGTQKEESPSAGDGGKGDKPDFDFEFGPREEDRTPWKFDKSTEGKPLKGLLESASIYHGQAGDCYLLGVRDTTGKLFSLITPTDLKRQFEERWDAGVIGIGMPIAIIYDGEKKLPNGNRFKQFRMRPDLPSEVRRAQANDAISTMRKKRVMQPDQNDTAHGSSDGAAPTSPSAGDNIPF